MDFIIAGVCIAICIAVIIFGLKVLRENRKILAEKKEKAEENDIHF